VWVVHCRLCTVAVRGRQVTACAWIGAVFHGFGRGGYSCACAMTRVLNLSGVLHMKWLPRALCAFFVRVLNIHTAGESAKR